MRRGYRRPPFLTIGVWCSWLNSANCKLSIKVLVSAFFICVWLLHISADICMFLMFAVNSLRVRRCWQSANLIAKMCPKCINNYATIHQKPCKIHPKSMKMVSRSAPKATLGASRLEVATKGAKSSYILCFFCGFFATLGRFWAPFGTQLGAKGVPKSSIWGSRRAQSRKNSLQEEV